MSETLSHSPSSPKKRFALPRLSGGGIGAIILLVIAAPCLVTLPISLDRYHQQVFKDRIAPTFDAKAAVLPTAIDADTGETYEPYGIEMIMGSDELGRSMLWRCLLGGAISLCIGFAAAIISVFIGVMWGAMSGLAGGRTDAAMMRSVDILYGLPYILLVVLVKIAMEPAVTDFLLVWSAKLSWMGFEPMEAPTAKTVASVVTLLVAIGGVSWLTMSRVIRGQVLSLRELPFVEAARACGAKSGRILRVHLLPNLVGPIVVYTTLTVPTAILQESFLSFLGIGVQPPLPSWGILAADGIKELPSLSLEGSEFKWWILVWPCLLLGLTLMALNFLGEALRNRVDPRSVKEN